MSKILSVGQIMVERQYLVDNIAIANEVSFARKINTLASSKELNASRILSKNNQVYYLSCVGKDNDGENVLQNLGKYRINYDLVSSTMGDSTGQVVVMTDSKGASAITVFVGANDDLEIGNINLEEYDFVYTSSANPLDKVYKLIEEANKNGVPILVDFPNKQKEFDKNKLRNIDFVVPNRQEAGLLVDDKILVITDALRTAMKLKDLTDGSVIITLDKDGCVAFEKDWLEPKHYPIKKINVVDMTASGDIFRGVFVDHILKTSDFEKSVEKALLVATESCLYEGVDKSIEESLKLL